MEQLSDRGEIVINGIDGIGVSKFGDYIGLAAHDFKQKILAAGLKPIGRTRSGFTVVDVYSKDEVEALEYVKKNRKR
jgi:hypothetical protein